MTKFMIGDRLEKITRAWENSPGQLKALSPQVWIPPLVLISFTILDRLPVGDTHEPKFSHL